MQYECTSCKKHFIHTSKRTTPAAYLNLFKDQNLESFQKTEEIGTIETYVCPFCFSKEYIEYTEPETTESPINVLVIDLTSGPQIAIDRALADGYKIVNRYAKQYVLEKTVKSEATKI